MPPPTTPRRRMPRAAPPRLRRGAQARLPLRAAIIGGGLACRDLLAILDQERLKSLNLEVVGVADPDPQAPGMVRAREMGIFTTPDFSQLYQIAGLNLIIELTGHPGVRDRVLKQTPRNISIIDHRGSRLIWDLVQIELEKTLVERQAEDNLERERDWFQEILDSLPDNIMVLDQAMNVVMANRTLLAATGLRLDQVLGRACHQVRHGLAEPCHQPGMRCPFREVLATRAPVVLLHSRPGPGGQTIHEEVMASPILGPDGEVRQVVEGVRDVTSRVRLENELHQTEGTLMAVMEAAQELISIKDLEGRYLYANPAALQLSGLSLPEIRGRTDFEVFPPEVARALAEQDRLAHLSRAPLCFDEMMSLGGQGHWLHTVRYPIFTREGELVALSIISHDVTEEKALEEEVRQGRDYLEAILTNSSDMIITTDLDGKVVTINPAGARLLGYDPAEIVGQSIERLWKSPEQRRQLMRLVQEQGEVSNFPAVLLAREGHGVEISLSLARLTDSQGRVLGTVGISRDMTEENRLKRELIANERLAAIGQTVAGLAHCIKNILFGLKGGAYLIDTGLQRQDPQRVEEGWQTVQACIGRISNLSLDMLSYSRDRVPHRQPTDPAQLVETALALVRQSADLGGVTIQTEVDPGPPLPLDGEALTRVLLNLVSNALDACHDKDYPPGQTPLVRVEVRRQTGRLLLIVDDNGVGMGDDIRRQLFTRFFSTKDARGTGLGLAVSQKIVTEQGGEISVQSTPGQGSRFTVVLPDPDTA
ncbi:MAG: PAS domain-containing protein [Desulfarculus sp.]|nr:PAS domain-containing protein [Desulfarculus sp.]